MQFELTVLGVALMTVVGMLISTVNENNQLRKRIEKQNEVISDMAARLVDLEVEIAIRKNPDLKPHADLTACNWPKK